MAAGGTGFNCRLSAIVRPRGPLYRRLLQVAKLTAFHERPKSLFGIDKGRLKILGDIISPIDVEWEAEVYLDRVLNP